MKNKLFSYNQNTQRLYLSHPVVVGLILSGLTMFGLLIFWVIFLYSFSQPQYSFDQTLGVVPPELQGVANDPEKAANGLVQKKGKQYGNTFNINFFLDGYRKSEDGVAYANALKKALQHDVYFKNVLFLISITIFTSEGQKCSVTEKTLVCDKRTMEAFQKLGIKHMKAVVLSPLDFKAYADQAQGRNSFLYISTNNNKNLESQFIDGLKKSISLDLIPAAQQEQYLNGVMYCFYGGKESYIFSDGTFNSCTEFMEKYPDFWIK